MISGMNVMRTVLLTALFFVSACTGAALRPDSAVNSAAREQIEKADALAMDLTAMTGAAGSAEASRVAETAVICSLRLAAEYRMVRPALFHNILVRTGIKDRGLCYHWTEDLITELNQLELTRFRLHRAVAYPGSTLFEHNSIVITGTDQDFDQGLVLDPWRRSGILFWSPVTADRYPWRERTD